MNQSDKGEMQGTYDAVVSLGRDCMVAYQLERLGLRRYSCPFDWIVLGEEGLISAFENRLQGFMDRENLSVYDDHVPGYWLVEDRCYEAWFYHEFQHTPGYPALYDYAEQRATVDRRMARLSRLIEQPVDLLVVRRVATMEQSERLFEAIESWRGERGRLDLLVVDPSVNELEVRGTRHRIRFRTNSEMGDLAEHPDAWKGVDSEWDDILRGVSLSPVLSER